MREVKSWSTYINQHRGLYNGRCFIVASGPSIAQIQPDPLAKLDNEYSYGISSLLRWPDLPFMPTFYLSQEMRYWWFYQQLIDHLKYPGLRMHSNQYSADLPSPWVLVHDDREYDLKKGDFNGFGERLDWVAGQGGSATLIAAQIAVFMGFREIYMLGCEASLDGYVWDKSAARNAEDTQRFIECTSLVYKSLKEKGVALIDLTENGNLTIPKSHLDAVL
jgi:hypothetical protein